MYGNEDKVAGLAAQLKQRQMDPYPEVPKPVTLHDEVAQEINQLHASVIKQENPVDIFDELRAAQEVYRQACLSFQKAALKRDLASKIVGDISSKAQGVIEAAMRDPTEPQAMQAGQQIPGNGRW